MAQGENFFGMKSGSTKSLTFAVRGGKQIIKDRVYRIKNPRSAMQMRQRILMAACGLAYKAMGQIVNHSWEGVPTGQNSYSKFMAVNLPLLKADANANAGRFGYPLYKVGSFVPGSFQISDGTLPVAERPIVNAIDGEHETIKLRIPCDNMAQFCQENGLRIGAYHTICVIFPTSTYAAYKFGYVRLAVLDDSADQVNADNVNSKFSANAGAGFRNATLGFEGGYVEVTAVAPGIPANTLGNTFACAINSREGDGVQLRSKASFVCVGIGPSSAQAFATWPVGKSLPLNGGSVVSSASGSGEDSGQQAATTYQVTTQRSGDFGSAVVSLAVDGSSVASGSYIEAGKTVNVTVTNAADISAIRLNGQEISSEIEGTTATASFVMPSASAVVTAAFPVNQGGDGGDEPFDPGN